MVTDGTEPPRDEAQRNGEGLDSVVGRTYGPVGVELARSAVAAYVAATSDDEARWVDFAPPSYAGALLFAVAPQFLADTDVAPHATMVIHGEQTFEWNGPFEVGSRLHVAGSLDKVRERGGVALATFSTLITDATTGANIVTGRSTFLMSGDAPPGGDVAERVEPGPDKRATVESPKLVPELDGVDSGEPDVVEVHVPTLSKSASRSDLVRYAAASGDFNPIHWDHGLAVSAGLGGVVAHGLLAAAWSTQAATQLRPGPRPLVGARIRFRNPLYPAVQARVAAVVEDSKATATVRSGETDHVVAELEFATAKPDGDVEPQRPRDRSVASG